MIKFQINLWTCPCCFAFIFIPFPLRFCSIFLWACHVIYWALRKYGSHRQYTRQLQSVFNAAARLVFSTRKSEHVTPLLQELHWLKVPERIQFRLCVLVHRCLHGNAPPYLAETLRLTSDVESRRRLRSGSTSTLLVPSTRPSTSHTRWPVLFQWSLHGPGMHCLRRSEHRRRTWHFVASWKHCHSRHPLKTGHDCAIYLLHSVNCKFWHNVLYSAPAAFFAIVSL